MDNTINFFFVVDRYDMDFDDDVLYCYEIQLEADLMRQGLGRLVSVSVFVSGFHFRFPIPVSVSGLGFPFLSYGRSHPHLCCSAPSVPPRAVLWIRILDLVPF